MFFRPKVIHRPRSKHNISRKNIDPDALRILQRLSTAGYTAYLVGGSVRDLLLGREPKDFDVSTDAHPGALKRLFRNCFLIGRRFRLAHIIFDNKKIIETSTFRRAPENTPEQEEGSPYQYEDNTFGTPEEDAKRRDFTVNALFYDIKTFDVIDYVGGLKDLAAKTLRTIGDPNVRFREDPVRMMRAARLAARLGFRIDWGSRRAMKRHAAEILNASIPRVQEEIMRLFTHRSAEPAFRILWGHGLLQHLVPGLDRHINASGQKKSAAWDYLRALDADPISPDASNSLRIAALFYPLFKTAFGGDVKPAHNRGARAFQTRQLLDEFASHYKLSHMTRLTTVALIEALTRFENTAPDSERGQRFATHPIFTQALALHRIILAAEKRADPRLAEWEKAAVEKPGQPGFEYKKSRVRKRRFGRGRRGERGEHATPDDTPDTVE